MLDPEYESLMVRESRFSTLVNSCWDHCKSLSEAKIHLHDETKTAIQIKDVLTAAQRLRSAGATIIEFLKELCQSVIKNDELKARFSNVESDASELGLELLENKIRKMYQ